MVRTTGDDQPSAGASMNAKDDAGQEHHHGRRAQVISSADRIGAARFGDVPCAQDDHHHRDRDVDEEDPPPGSS